MNKFFASFVVAFVAFFYSSFTANSQSSNFVICATTYCGESSPTIGVIGFDIQKLFINFPKKDSVEYVIKYNFSGGSTYTKSGTFIFENYHYDHVYLTHLVLDTTYYIKGIFIVNKKDTINFDPIGTIKTGIAQKPQVGISNMPVPIYNNAIIARGHCFTYGLPTTVYFKYAVNGKFTKQGPIHIIDPNDWENNGEFKDSIAGLDSGTIYPFYYYGYNAKSFSFSEILPLFTSGTGVVGINSETKNPFTIYPNPTTDYINITSVRKGTFILFDSQGKIVVSEEIDEKETYIQFPEKLSSGLYSYKITTPTKNFSGKISIKN